MYKVESVRRHYRIFAQRDEAARAGIRIVDVRHECAAVYMAHAQADLTGSLGVAMVTAGPGLTNAITGIANASVSRSPVLGARRPGWALSRIWLKES